MRQVDAASITCSAHNIQLAASKGLQHDDITSLVSKSSAVVDQPFQPFRSGNQCITEVSTTA